MGHHVPPILDYRSKLSTMLILFQKAADSDNFLRSFFNMSRLPLHDWLLDCKRISKWTVQESFLLT